MSDVSFSLIAKRFASVLREPMARAIAIAALLTLALAVAVVAAWSVDPGDDGSPLAGVPGFDNGGPTPTPRVIVPRPARTATSAATSDEAEEAETEEPPATTEPGDAPAATEERDAPTIARPPTSEAPEPTAEAPEPTATPTPRPEPTATPATPASPEALYVARSGDDLSDWASGSWSVDGDRLVFQVATNDAEAWTVGPFRPDEDAYAVEAELRVQFTDRAVGCQTFGLVTATADIARGGGVAFGCPPQPIQAGLRDVSNWETGYFRTPELDTAAFDPGDGWHTYRLEVRGRDLRLLIDDEDIAESTTTAGLPAGVESEIGLWSQGVGLEVRRIAVLPLDASED